MARLMKQTAEVRLCNCATGKMSSIYCISMPLTNSKYNIKHIKQLESVSHEIISGTLGEQLGLQLIFMFILKVLDILESVQSYLSTHSLGIWLAVFLHDAHTAQCCICIIVMSEMINNKMSRAQLSPQVQQDVCSDCRLKNKHESRRKRWDVCWAEPNHHHFIIILGSGLMGIICTINKDVQNYSLHSVKCFSRHFPCNDFKRYKICGKHQHWRQQTAAWMPADKRCF